MLQTTAFNIKCKQNFGSNLKNMLNPEINMFIQSCETNWRQLLITNKFNFLNNAHQKIQNTYHYGKKISNNHGRETLAPLFNYYKKHGTHHKRQINFRRTKTVKVKDTSQIKMGFRIYRLFKN